MALLKGKDGTVAVGALNVACITSWSVSIEADTLETTCMGNAGFKTYVGSLQSWSGSLEANMDSTDDTITVGSTVSLTLAIGTDLTYTGDAVVTALSVDAGVADLVTMSIDFQGTGALSY